jgi:hypothetical protein
MVSNGLSWILLLFSFYLSSNLPRRFSCPLYHVYGSQHKKNPPKLDDVIIFATIYIAIGSTTTFVDGAFTTISIDSKEINTPICSIVASTNQGKAIIQVSESKSSGFHIDLEICWNDLFEKELPTYNAKLHAMHSRPPLETINVNKTIGHISNHFPNYFIFVNCVVDPKFILVLKPPNIVDK